MPPIRLLEIGGTHYEMGYHHGLAYADSIREFTAERLRLAGDPLWTGQSRSQADILALGDACLAAHQDYAPDLMEELRGTADATGLSQTELVIMNGFTDFADVIARPDHPSPHDADNCTAFIVPNGAGGQGLIGQTWDMHYSATPYVVLLRGRPAGKPAFLVFTITGCVGMIGMNDAGIAVGINDIMANDGRPGVTWPFVVRRMLEQSTLDDALACLLDAPLAGAHNYVLADSAGRGYNVEAMPSHREVTAVNGNPFVHTNHCLHAATLPFARPRLDYAQENSESRLERAHELLNGGAVTVDDLMALTRDRGALNGICTVVNAPWEVETCGAAIMRPATREFWAVWGLPTENAYERFVV